MPPKDKYTDPELREEVKEELKEGDKGGAPGQWSARKAQMMASEYKKRGGGYTTDKETGQDESQKNLQKWGEEEWQTKEGSGNAKQADGTEKRYLPKKAWQNMSEEEKQKTEDKKQEGSKEGKQFVENTEGAKEARKEVNKEETEKIDRTEAGGKGKSGSHGKKAAKKDEEENVAAAEGEEHDDDNDKENVAETEERDPTQEEDGEEGDEYIEDEGDEEDEGVEEPEGDGEDKENGRKASAGNKRGRSVKDTNGPSKKQKSNSGKGKDNSKASNGTVGSKHDPAEPPAQQGSADRLPEKGQKVFWKSLPGWVDGEVVEIVREEKEIEGKMIKGGKEKPMIALRSTKSGKIASHKPDAVHFD